MPSDSVGYDWPDEVLHVQCGRKWLSCLFGGDEESREEFIAEIQQVNEHSIHATD